MPTQILAIGGGDANSSDVVVAAGATLTVSLKDDAGPRVGELEPNTLVRILLKDDAGEYFQVGRLDADTPVLVIQGAGTYRFTRMSGGRCGVFSA